MNKKIFVFLLLVLPCSNAFAESQEKNNEQKILSGTFWTDFYSYKTYQSDDKQNEYISSFIKSSLRVKLNLTKHLFLNARARITQTNQSNSTINPNQSSVNRNNEFLGHEAIYLERLNLNYEDKKYSLLAGKFTADFGSAWHNSRDNIWLREIPTENYRENEKLGFAASLKAGNEKTIGKYIFNLSSFTNDRKYLDNSAITLRDNPSKSAGRPGDAGGLSSYAVSMNVIFDFDIDEKLSYHFGYLNLATNPRQSPVTPSKIEDEKGYAANINYRFPLDKNVVANLLAEYVTLDNFNGNIDNRANFLTTNLSMNFYQNWLLNIGKVKENIFSIGENGVDISTFEISAGYKFSNNSFLKNFQILIGHKEDSVDYKTNILKSRSFGTLIRYLKEF